MTYGEPWSVSDHPPESTYAPRPAATTGSLAPAGTSVAPDVAPGAASCTTGADPARALSCAHGSSSEVDGGDAGQCASSPACCLSRRTCGGAGTVFGATTAPLGVITLR